jgi:hypothetical protein
MPERANTPTVNSIEEGFKVVQTPYGPNFHCEACDVEVDRRPPHGGPFILGICWVLAYFPPSGLI